MSRNESPVTLASVKRNGPCTLSRDMDVECGFIGDDQSLYETIFLHFQLHLLANSRLFTLSAGVRACTNRFLHGLKHSRLHNTFHTAMFGISSSLLALAGTSLKRLTHSFSVVIRHTGSTRTPAFTQASSLHKLSGPPGYTTFVWCVFSKPCTKLTLHCYRRSGHLKTEHTESLLLLWRHLGNGFAAP
jgi:hypothetical protein